MSINTELVKEARTKQKNITVAEKREKISMNEKNHKI